jgi:hypothetical protein
MPRDYAKEYKTHHGEPGQMKRRDARNTASAIMVKTGWYGKGMDNILITKPITH